MATRFFHIEKFQGILNWVEDILTREEVIKLFFATENVARTGFHVATRSFHIEKFHGILNWVVDILTRE